MNIVELKIEGLGDGDIERIRKLYNEIINCADMGNCQFKVEYKRRDEE